MLLFLYYLFVCLFICLFVKIVAGVHNSWFSRITSEAPEEISKNFDIFEIYSKYNLIKFIHICNNFTSSHKTQYIVSLTNDSNSRVGNFDECWHFELYTKYDLKKKYFHL